MNRTSTFLFADLRGYTAFVEEHGDATASDLIASYRKLVRERVARTRGAEIKTEGDSFFVVFATAGQALACAVSILRAAERHTRAEPELPIAVGVGLHAGEPVRHDRGYVGSAVNIAARLAQNAAADELLISETVRGLLRTSGLPPLAERTDVMLKGVADAPRVWSVDWRAASPELDVAPLVRRVRPRVVAGVVTAVVAALAVLGASRMLVASPPAGNATSAPAAPVALPPHGALLFELDRTPAGARQLRVGLGDPTRDAVRYLGDALEITASAGSAVSLSVVDLAPDDFVADVVAATVRGQGTYAFWFRGADGRQVQALIAPQTGELTVQVTRPLEPAVAPERLFGPASRVPRGVEQRFAVAARARDIVIYRDGVEVARATDARPVGGAVGFVVTASRDRELVIRMNGLRVYAP